ncbi:MAG: ATP-grasp domain-containing protein [Vulcanimicrobiaceae bacterium]
MDSIVTRGNTTSFTALIATCQTWLSTTTLPALLADAGVKTTALSPWPLSLSRHVQEHIKASRNPRKAAAQLRETLARRHFDWVIVADEELLRALVEDGELTSLVSWFPVDPLNADALGLLLSKHAFAERAPKLEIPIPESRFARSVDEAAACAEAFGYPVVLKGAHGFAGLDVHVITGDTALRHRAAELLGRHERVLIQRFIQGVQASASVLYDRGTVVGYSAYLARCCHPTANSPSTVHERFRHPAIEPIIRTIGAATRFHGFAGIDFMYDASTGELFALEVNPRPTIGFSGTAGSREFFAPLVKNLLRRAVQSTVAYAGRRPVDVYFPAYLFYFLTRAEKRSLTSYRRALACLAEFRPADFKLAAWQIARFVYDEIGKRLPVLRARLDGQRRKGPPSGNGDAWTPLLPLPGTGETPTGRPDRSEVRVCRNGIATPVFPLLQLRASELQQVASTE